MNRFIYILVIIVFSCSSNSSVRMQPLLSEDTLFLGNVSYDDTVHSKLHLINPNDKDIKVLSMVSSCGCVVPEITDSIIKAKDTAIINVVYVPATSKDTGVIQKSIAIRTNLDPPFKSIPLKGVVIKKNTR
jgi:hypothetical protein